MNSRVIVIAASLSVLAACQNNEEAASVEAPAEEIASAEPMSASVVGTDGAEIGTVTVTQDANGTTIKLDVTGLGEGMHGVHLHEAGLCETPDFKSAGGHWNPMGKQHGRDNPEGAHTGDLANLSVGADGIGTASYLVSGVLMDGGETAMADADGTALVIHEGPDDYVTDPSGDSGSRVGCAVLAAPQG